MSESEVNKLKLSTEELKGKTGENAVNLDKIMIQTKEVDNYFDRVRNEAIDLFRMNGLFSERLMAAQSRLADALRGLQNTIQEKFLNFQDASKQWNSLLNDSREATKPFDRFPIVTEECIDTENGVVKKVEYPGVLTFFGKLIRSKYFSLLLVILISAFPVYIVLRLIRRTVSLFFGFFLWMMRG